MSVTASPLTRFLGFAALVSLAGTAVLGLWVTDPDVVQGDLVRLIYIHPAIATYGEALFGVTALASLLYLWPRTRRRRWDLLAGASAEVGVVFAALTLVTGSIWGRPTWGVWWTWDARLTSTALLLALFLGYLALRRAPIEDAGRRSIVAAVGALVAAVDVPIVHYSVQWWRTLHQGPTLLRPHPLIHGQAPPAPLPARRPRGAARPAGPGPRHPRPPGGGARSTIRARGGAVSYVVAGYGISALVLLGYAARTVVRGRRLARRLPPEERAWR